MAPPKIAPVNESRKFTLSELFFSTTDKRGAIRYGNEVFCRIAGYTLDEMAGQPHNIIRHPDMPRSAFKLVWDYLESSRTVAAYVKNMASDGRYYWVLAVIMPTPEGYLSIRLKPSSEVFAVVQQAYGQVLEAERLAEEGGAARKEAIAAGGAKLTELLAGLGYASYDEFMWSAVAAESTSREANRTDRAADAALPADRDDGTDDDGSREQLLTLFRKSRTIETQLGDMFARPGSFSQLRDEIIPKTRFILSLGNTIRRLSLNAEAEAARLGESALALAMVAGRLGFHAAEGIETIEQLNERLRGLTGPIAKLIFDSIVSKIQIEMTACFIREILHHRGDAARDDEQLRECVRLLTRTFLATARQILPALHRLQNDLARVDKDVQDLRRFLKTLSFIYFTGKVETARNAEAAGFTTIFDQVKDRIQESEAVISEFLEQVNANADQLASIGRLDTRTFDELDALIAA